jgi:penicillin-binding protein 1A
MGDDTYERSMGDEDASYTTATPMWTDFMGDLVAGVPHDKLTDDRPPGIRSKVVAYTTGSGDHSAILYFRDE